MLLFAYIAEGWELVSIRSLEDGFSSIKDDQKQIFFFDDFLGKVALDSRALANKDSELATFLSRVRRSPNSRFILTTRAYIFEEARRVSEHLSDKRLDISKYVLDVSVYTRAVRARILYNHLVVSELPKNHLNSLLDSDVLKSIIDHENYNPRIIEWMTDPIRAVHIHPGDYAASFLESLDNPSDIWDTAFRKHLSAASQDLLVTLFFFDEWGVDIEKLRIAYEPVHRIMCEAYGRERSPKDFEDSLRTLEGSFISIHGQRVRFINPSVSDYLTRYLSDRDLLIVLAKGARFIRWAERLEDHFTEAGFEGIVELVSGFRDLAHSIAQKPVKHFDLSNGEFEDASNGSKLRSVTRWWLITADGGFLESATYVAHAPTHLFVPWRDGVPILETLSDLERANEMKLGRVVTGLATELFASEPDLDDLQRMLDFMDERPGSFPESVKAAAHTAIEDALESLPTSVRGVDSESTLEDYLFSIEELARRVSADTLTLTRAKNAIEERMMIVRDTSDDGWTFDGPSDDPERFTDRDLSNLFAPLRNSNI